MNGSPMPMQEMAAGQLQAVAGGGKRCGKPAFGRRTSCGRGRKAHRKRMAEEI